MNRKVKTRSTICFAFDTSEARLLFENFVHFVALVGPAGLAEPAALAELVVEMFAAGIVCSLKSYNGPMATKRSTDGFVAVAEAATLATRPDKFGEFG